LVAVYDRKGKEVYSGKTPAQVTLKTNAGYFRRAIYTIEINRDGYARKTIELSANVNNWYYGNLLFGGVIGFLIVDPVTGAMYRLNEKDIYTTLLPAPTASETAEKTLNICYVSDLPLAWQKRLVKL
jgi:hypothetical protein